MTDEYIASQSWNIQQHHETTERTHAVCPSPDGLETGIFRDNHEVTGTKDMWDPYPDIL